MLARYLVQALALIVLAAGASAQAPSQASPQTSPQTSPAAPAGVPSTASSIAPSPGFLPNAASSTSLAGVAVAAAGVVGMILGNRAQ